jgi:hypothetical protein
VTRIAVCPPTGMHGLDVAFTSLVKKICHSPQSIFADHGSLLQNSSASDLNEADLFEAAFHSPTATFALQRLPRQGQRSWPTPSKSHRTLYLTRSALDSLPRFRFAENGETHRPKPVVKSVSGTPSLRPDFRSPSGFLHPSGS